MAGELSYQSTKDIAKSKNGYTVSIDDLAGSLQEIKQILNNMLNQRTETGDGGACPAVYCTSHASTVNTDSVGLTYTGNLSLNKVYATANDLEALTCSSQVDCSCVSRTAIDCGCNTRMDVTYVCQTRTSCDCDYRSVCFCENRSYYCFCENRTSECNCDNRTSQCNCDTRTYAPTCLCNARQYVIDDCDCQNRIYDPTCYCDTRFSYDCACDYRTTSSCNCDVRTGDQCNCDLRTGSVCNCDNRTAVVYDQW